MLRSTTSGGQIGIALSVVLVFNGELLRLVETWTQIETPLGAIARLKSLEERTEREDREGEDFLPPDNWPETGRIEFRNVCASYGCDIFLYPLLIEAY